MVKFVHLHTHSEYSLLDGICKIDELISHAKQLGMDALSITDHGVMYGAIEFYKKCKAQSVKPIIGMEGYITKDHKKKDRTSRTNHILLLAKNEEGYKNLMKLTSISHLEGFYYKPRIDHQLLKRYSSGLICATACGSGEIPQTLYEESYDKVKEVAGIYTDIFGDDFYIEIQERDYSDAISSAKNDEIKNILLELNKFKEKVNPLLIKLSRDMGIPIIATNDVHYIKKDDAFAQDAAVCVSTGKLVSDIKRLRYIDFPDYYLKSPEEMLELHNHIPDSLENTIKVADKIDLNLSTLGKWYFPKFNIPKKMDVDIYLKEVVYDNLTKIFPDSTSEMKERVEYELEIIIKKGYSTYFLIVMDFVKWCDEKGIITNTRGSAAGSFISFLLGITKVNPLIYYLPFERFLNPYRPSPPDIDLDIADDKREELIKYISEKYGYDKVAQLCTFGRMLSRQSVRDVARVLGYQYIVGDNIAKSIPPPKQGFPITIPKALGTVEEFKKLYDSDKDSKLIIDLAKQIEGNARHISVHAAGIVISPSVITDFTPIQKEPSGEKIITQYEMHAAEDVGLIKFDILEIRNLSILGEAINIVEATRNIRIDIRNILLDDSKTFEMLGQGNTMGVFQLSSGGMTKYLIDLKPQRVEDLMAMVALYRPGPIAVIPEYIKRKQNSHLIKYPDPRMEKFLKASYGLIVYQDDLLFSAIDLAGYTWEEADKFRKAVGKKIPEEMAAQKEKFIKGIVDNGQTKDFADKLWKLFEPFQSYGFNKSHAASYGMVAYQTAYMKANYPVEFMCALLSAESKDKIKVSQAVHECKRLGIVVLPPDINESGTGFSIVKVNNSIDNMAIRFGLDAIKNVGAAAIDNIVSERNENHFKNFYDFLTRIDNRKVNKKVLESLIKVGALSSFGKRSLLLKNLDDIRNKLNIHRAQKNQPALFAQDPKDMNSIDFDLNDSPEFTEEEIQVYEKELLGFSMSGKSISELISGCGYFITHKIVDLNSETDTSVEINLAGVINELRVIITKKSGREMAFLKLEDDTGTLDVVIFPNVYDKYKSHLTENKPIMINGKVDERSENVSFIANDISINDPGVITIRISKNTKVEKLKKLKEYLINIPGDHQLCLYFENTQMKKTIPLKISWDDDISKNIYNILDQN